MLSPYPEKEGSVLYNNEILHSKIRKKKKLKLLRLHKMNLILQTYVGTTIPEFCDNCDMYSQKIKTKNINCMKR